MFAKAAWNLPKLDGRLDDVSVIDAGLIFENKPFDLLFEGLSLYQIEADLTLLLSGPYKRAIESFRGEIGCEKRDRVETERSCRIDRIAQMTVIRFLDGGSTGYRNRGAKVTNRGDAFVDEIVGSANAPDRIVDILGAIEGDDDFIKETGNLCGAFVQEKPRR